MSASQPNPVKQFSSPHVAVIGAGITGLTTAFYLLRAGYRVTVLEAREQAGGLATSFDFGPFHWDKFYHCILTSDASLLGLIEDLDLTSELTWTTTEVGFFSQNKLYRMTRPADLLAFPHLSLLDKVRFGMGTVYAARFCDGHGLEDVPLRDWVIRIFGEKLHREIWDPLLRCKLGELRDSASAAFLHSTLKRLYSTREKGAEKKEKLGFVKGGYKVVLSRLVERIERLGGDLRYGVHLDRIESRDSKVWLHENGDRQRIDSAVVTVPNRAAAALLPELPAAFHERLLAVKYLGMVCVVLLLRRPLSPFYVTNITQKARFTGIIEMTNLIGTKATHGYSLVYLPKYTVPSDPLFTMTDEEVWQEYSLDLFRMHPTLHSSDIVSRFVFRERAVQPLPTLRYSEVLPPMNTPMSGVFLANTSQIVNDTLNNNIMTGIARKASEAVIRFHTEQARECESTAGSRSAALHSPREGEIALVPSLLADSMETNEAPEDRYGTTVDLTA
ncbi:MAG: NAD(P)/FAD-dependent oxidoreductase [Acidobacteriaceae bacterium]